MDRISRQMAGLLGVSALSSFRLGGAAWVALLAARGFSMVEIGVAEGVFHVASLLFEIPSGVIADVFGRRRSMALSRLMGLVSSLLMAFSTAFPDVCLALIFSAFSYNFESGAREALAYDSLAGAGRQAQYMRYASLDMAVYRMGSAAALLLAGTALMLGYRLANLLDAATELVGLCIVLGLKEARLTPAAQAADARGRAVSCVRGSVAFLRTQREARRIMLFNAAVGAASILLTFFLQAQLPLAGLPAAALGPALFAMGLGGALGARLALRFEKTRYPLLGALCAAGVLLGLALGVSGVPALMILGGVLANVLDDLFQVRTDSLLNSRFPAEQRATLVSVSSLCFSLVMMVLSPLAGLLFQTV